MYDVINQDVVNAIESGNPLYGVRLEGLSDNRVYSGDNIFSASSDISTTTLSDDIELGAICSRSLSLKMTGVENDRLLGGEFKFGIYARERSKSGTLTYGDLEVYSFSYLASQKIGDLTSLGEIIGGEVIPIGTFTCVKHEKRGDISQPEMYDRLYFSDSEYVPGVDLPASSQAIENDICSQIGCENGNDYSETSYLTDSSGKNLFEKNGLRLKTESFEFTVTEIPRGCTKRQMLSYIAAVCGQFGYIDRNGEYIRKQYGSRVCELTKNSIDEPTISQKSNRIIGIVCKSGEQTFTLGSSDKSRGRVLEFENPYMTESLFKSLFVKVKNFEWYTAQIKQRIGDPRIDPGDVVGFGNCNIPVTNLKLEFGGGLSADISAAGLAEEELR